MDGIPWNQTVQLFEADGRGRNLNVRYSVMSLREALKAFLHLPVDQQQAAGIGLHEPIRMEIDGRPALVGWYNAEACRKLATMMVPESAARA